MNTHHVPGPAGLLAIEQVGWEGVPIVALHGAGTNASQWNAVLKRLKPRRFVTIDLRGQGRSAPPSDGRFDVPAMADDVRAVAEALRLERFVVVGQGFGAAVALEAARDARVVAVGLVGDPEMPESSGGPAIAARVKGDLSVLASSLGAWTRPAIAVPVVTLGTAWAHLESPDAVAEALRKLP